LLTIPCHRSVTNFPEGIVTGNSARPPCGINTCVAECGGAGAPSSAAITIGKGILRRLHAGAGAELKIEISIGRRVEHAPEFATSGLRAANSALAFTTTK
jgi:hypothetical protein